MGEIRVTKDDRVTPFIQETIDNLPDYAETAINNVSSIFFEYGLEYTPIGETNQLYDLTIIDIDGFLDRSIWSTAPEWDWVILGTQPHEILPVNKKALYWPNAMHPVKRVEHPGTIANDYPALAYMDGMFEAETSLDDFLGQIVGDS